LLYIEFIGDDTILYLYRDACVRLP